MMKSKGLEESKKFTIAELETYQGQKQEPLVLSRRTNVVSPSQKPIQLLVEKDMEISNLKN